MTNDLEDDSRSSELPQCRILLPINQWSVVTTTLSSGTVSEILPHLQCKYAVCFREHAKIAD